MIRRIGRRLSDASPMIVEANGRPARAPTSRRIVVPELPASSGASGARHAATPRPATVTVRSPPEASGVSATATPSPRRQASVDPQSAPVEYPVMVDGPSAAAASMA